MEKKYNINCNFETVLSQFNTIEDVKNVATIIVNKVNEAYQKRAGELKVAEKSKSKPKSASVKAESAPTPKQVGKTVAKEKPKPARKEEEPLISITDTKAIKKLNLRFEKYSERSWALYGDTKPIRQGLKELGGAYNRFLKDGEGWIFNNKNAETCAKKLGLQFA